jgi:hypothetical protein
LIRAEDPTSRIRLFSLFQVLHNLHVSLSSDDMVARVTRFLRASYPLNYNAKEKKSQVHHAMCRMLVSVLRPLIFEQVRCEELYKPLSSLYPVLFELMFFGLLSRETVVPLFFLYVLCLQKQLNFYNPAYILCPPRPGLRVGPQRDAAAVVRGDPLVPRGGAQVDQGPLQTLPRRVRHRHHPHVPPGERARETAGFLFCFIIMSLIVLLLIDS